MLLPPTNPAKLATVARGVERYPARLLMPAQPCLTCRKPTTNGARCAPCSTAYETARVARRGTRAQRGYGQAWIKASKAAIKASPICAVCGTTEDLTGDHLLPKSKGGTAEHGVRVLCRYHNSSRGNRPG